MNIFQPGPKGQPCSYSGDAEAPDGQENFLTDLSVHHQRIKIRGPTINVLNNFFFEKIKCSWIIRFSLIEPIELKHFFLCKADTRCNCVFTPS